MGRGCGALGCILPRFSLCGTPLNPKPVRGGKNTNPGEIFDVTRGLGSPAVFFFVHGNPGKKKAGRYFPFDRTLIWPRGPPVWLGGVGWGCGQCYSTSPRFRSAETHPSPHENQQNPKTITPDLCPRSSPQRSCFLAPKGSFCGSPAPRNNCPAPLEKTPFVGPPLLGMGPAPPPLPLKNWSLLTTPPKNKKSPPPTAKKPTPPKRRIREQNKRKPPPFFVGGGYIVPPHFPPPPRPDFPVQKFHPRGKSPPPSITKKTGPPRACLPPAPGVETVPPTPPPTLLVGGKNEHLRVMKTQITPEFSPSDQTFHPLAWSDFSPPPPPPLRPPPTPTHTPPPPSQKYSLELAPKIVMSKNLLPTISDPFFSPTGLFLPFFWETPKGYGVGFDEAHNRPRGEPPSPPSPPFMGKIVPVGWGPRGKPAPLSTLVAHGATGERPQKRVVPHPPHFGQCGPLPVLGRPCFVCWGYLCGQWAIR